MISVAVCADGFLYNMVRAIVGTMVYASHGKLEPEEIPALLERGDRRLTGPTMPPQGLYLRRVWYEGAVGEMMREDYPDETPGGTFTAQGAVRHCGGAHNAGGGDGLFDAVEGR